MEHEADANALAVEKYRSYLLLLAQMHVGREGGNRLDPSDLVQQTLLDAHRQREQFRGNSPAEMAAWLRRMLACNVADARRAMKRGKRDVNRERSLEAALAESSSRLSACLASAQSSPSQQAMRQEEILRLADGLTALSERQREAMLLHYWQGLPLAEVAVAMKRSPASVAGLLQRGLKALRHFLAEGD